MFEVKVCPRSKTEFDEAAKRRSCGRDKYGNSQYMCLPNVEKSSLVEFCYEGVMGIEPQGQQIECVELFCKTFCLFVDFRLTREFFTHL